MKSPIAAALALTLLAQSAQATVFRSCVDPSRRILPTADHGLVRTEGGPIADVLARTEVEAGTAALVIAEAPGRQGVQAYIKSAGDSAWRLIESENGYNSLLTYREMDRMMPTARRIHAVGTTIVAPFTYLLLLSEASLLTPAGGLAGLILFGINIASVIQVGGNLFDPSTGLLSPAVQARLFTNMASATSAVMEQVYDFGDAINPARHGDMTDMEKCLVEMERDHAADGRLDHALVFRIRGSNLRSRVTYVHNMVQDALDNVTAEELIRDTDGLRGRL